MRKGSSPPVSLIRAAAALAALFACTLSLCAIPRMVIVSRPPDPMPDGAVAFFLHDELAEAFASDGRVAPIAWSLTDPIYRSYVEDGVVAHAPQPDDVQVREGMKAFKADYLLLVQASVLDGAVSYSAWLYHRGREVWKDVPDKEEMRAFSVSVEGEDRFGELRRSLANTWLAQVTAGPMKNLKPMTNLVDPLDPGAEGGDPEIPVATPASEALVAKAQELLALGDVPGALLAMKRAVDADPLDMRLRTLLIQVMIEAGLNEQAAAEAQRATLFADRSPDLHLMAAKAYVRAGMPEEAKGALQEAQIRGASGPEAKLVEADVMLMTGQPSQAAVAYAEALVMEASPEGYLGLALASALEGNGEAAAQALADSGLAESPRRDRLYSFAVSLADPAIIGIGRSIADLLPMIRVGREPEKSQEIADDLSRRCAGIARFLDGLTPPEAHAESHEIRLLACLLMEQAASEAAWFSRGEAELGEEALISLSEAQQQHARARLTLKAEREGVIGDDNGSGINADPGGGGGGDLFCGSVDRI